MMRFMSFVNTSFTALPKSTFGKALRRLPHEVRK